MVNCCNHKSDDKICIRSSDGKLFNLPRKFSRQKCKNPKGFTMRSSCAPYKDCFKLRSKQSNKRSSKKSKQKGGRGESKRDNLKTAYFAGGCFWGIQEHFNKVIGVKNTLVGYMGGNIENPTYDIVVNNNTGHVETIKITYDPKIVSYLDLLNEFHKIRSKNINDNKSQYRSIIFTTDEDQNTEAENFIKNNPDVQLLFKKKLSILCS